MSLDHADIISNEKKALEKEEDDDGRLVESKNFMKARSQSLQSTAQQQHQAHVQQQQQTISSHHKSTTTLMSEKSFHKTISSSTSTSSSTVSAGQTTKTKFQSFLNHPDAPSAGQHSNTYLSVAAQQNQQKFVRQFVRSASAHSEGGNTSTKSIKGLRSSSTQMENDGIEQTLKVHQDSAVLISKSAENLETKVQFGTANRSQLTLSGGFLAPPNRKLTILSPVHSAPGLHELLKRQGRSPCSPKITFPGSENDLFL